MTVEELIDILQGLNPEMKVYYKIYNVAGYHEETALVNDYHTEPPGKKSYPEENEECLILDCNGGTDVL